jgi:hypothetical protein
MQVVEVSRRVRVRWKRGKVGGMENGKTEVKIIKNSNQKRRLIFFLAEIVKNRKICLTSE